MGQDVCTGCKSAVHGQHNPKAAENSKTNNDRSNVFEKLTKNRKTNIYEEKSTAKTADKNSTR